MIQAHLGYAPNWHRYILLRPDHVFTIKVYELKKRCCISLSILHVIMRRSMLTLNLYFEENVVVTYQQRNLKHCASNDYGSYLTLTLAQSACSSDSNCRGVYDTSCDNSGSFYLCPISADLKISSRSCVYEKIGS